MTVEAFVGGVSTQQQQQEAPQQQQYQQQPISDTTKITVQTSVGGASTQQQQQQPQQPISEATKITVSLSSTPTGDSGVSVRGGFVRRRTKLEEEKTEETGAAKRNIRGGADGTARRR